MILRFFLITIAVLWIIKLLARLVFPILFQKLVKKAQKNGDHSHQDAWNPYRDSRIRVDYIPPKKHQRTMTEEPFTDYEEIK